MQIEKIGINAANKTVISPVVESRNKSFNKAAHAKNCKYRTATGLCIRSSRICPATLFTLTFNN